MQIVDRDLFLYPRISIYKKTQTIIKHNGYIFKRLITIRNQLFL